MSFNFQEKDDSATIAPAGGKPQHVLDFEEKFDYLGSTFTPFDASTDEGDPGVFRILDYELTQRPNFWAIKNNQPGKDVPKNVIAITFGLFEFDGETPQLGLNGKPKAITFNVTNLKENVPDSTFLTKGIVPILNQLGQPTFKVDARPSEFKRGKLVGLYAQFAVTEEPSKNNAQIIYYNVQKETIRSPHIPDKALTKKFKEYNVNRLKEMFVFPTGKL